MLNSFTIEFYKISIPPTITVNTLRILFFISFLNKYFFKYSFNSNVFHNSLEFLLDLYIATSTLLTLSSTSSLNLSVSNFLTFQPL